MTQYCTFLRGINVGGLKIAMADLRQLLGELGLADVRTVLATGNAVFRAAATADALRPMLETALFARFGYDAQVLLRTREEIAALCRAAGGVTPPEGCHLYVLLCSLGTAAELEEVFHAEPREREWFQPVGQDAFWVVPKGMTVTTDFGAKVLGGKRFRLRVTTRNRSTLERVLREMERVGD